MADWVVRAGEARPLDLFKGYGRHILVPTLFGFSVQYAPGLTPPATVDDLARAGRFKNGQISYQYDQVLITAVTSLGYQARLIKSPGGGFHHTFAVLYTANGTMIQKLPQDAADALSSAFLRRPNPYQVP